MAETKSNTRQWYIYALHVNGIDFYVGRIFTPKRRVSQHRQRFGRNVDMRILQIGIGHERAVEAERSWMERLASEGVALRNKIKGSSGAWKVDGESLEKIRAASVANWNNSEYVERQHAALVASVNNPEVKERRRKSIKAMWADPVKGPKLRATVIAVHKGRPKSPETRAKISAAQNGVPKNWSPEGRIAVAAAGYQPGVNSFELLSEDGKRRKIAAAKKNWEGISPEERSRMATERNLGAWAKRTPEKRKEIGRKAMSAQKPEEIRQRALHASRVAAQRPNLSAETSAAAKSLWARMSPEEKAAFILRRQPAINAAKAKKKAEREAARAVA